MNGFHLVVSNVQETISSPTVKLVFDLLLKRNGYKTNPSHMSIQSLANPNAILSYLMPIITEEEEDYEVREIRQLIDAYKNLGWHEKKDILIFFRQTQNVFKLYKLTLALCWSEHYVCYPVTNLQSIKEK